MRLQRLLIGLLAAASLFSCKGRGDVAAVATDSVVDTIVVDTVPRCSVTFIMGHDNSAYNRYYEMAGHYYRINADDRTDVVVDNLTSLSQVMDWLRSHPDTVNHRPYGHINLVSHGNEFVDLQMTVTPRGARTSPEALRQALDQQLVVPTDSTLVDSLTVVFLHGCAVGQNQALLDGLAEAFGGRATVMASKLFEYYAYLSRNRNPQSLRHYYARTWYAFHHPDSAVDNSQLARQLKRRYPADKVRWDEGLRRRFQDNPAQIYHYSFTVPCTYEYFYAPDEPMPSFNSGRRRRQWVEQNGEFRQLLAQSHVPEEYFQIRFYRQTGLNDDGQTVQGLKVKARAGVICLIQPLVCTDSTGCTYAPQRPALDDTAIFAFSR